MFYIFFSIRSFATFYRDVLFKNELIYISIIFPTIVTDIPHKIDIILSNVDISADKFIQF